MTTPLVPTGIGYLDSATPLATFTTAVNRLSLDDWKDPGAGMSAVNAGTLSRPAMTALVLSGMDPIPALVVDSSIQGLAGIFYPKTWTIRASADLFAKKKTDITAAWMREKAIDLYHEARHAEQYWLGAKLVGMKTTTLTAGELAFQGLMKAEVYAAAVQKAKSSTAERVPATSETAVFNWVLAARLADDIMAERQSARSALIAYATTIEQADQALPADFTSDADRIRYEGLVQTHTQRAEELRDEYAKAFRAYLGLALEQDAYFVGALAGNAVPDPAAVALRVYNAHVAAALTTFEVHVRNKVDDLRRRLPPPAPTPPATTPPATTPPATTPPATTPPTTPP